MAISDNPRWMEALGRAPGLSEMQPMRITRISLLVLSMAVFVLLLWAGLTRVQVVSRSYGQVMPSGYVQVVQHLEGGMVEQIHVREGDRVKQGDVLLRLHDGATRSERNQLLQQQRALLMERERVAAYLENRRPDFSNLRGVDAQDLAEQNRAYESSQRAKNEEAQVIEAQIAQRRESLQALHMRSSALGKNIALANESLGIKQKLYEKGYYSRLNYLDKQEQVNSMRGEQAALSQEIQRTRSEIGEYERRLASLGASSRERSYDTLTRLNNEIAKNDEALGSYDARMDRLQVRAPVDGIVKGVEVNTVGGIVASGQKLMEIVPTNDTLNVEARIRPSDVGQMRPGLPVTVKVHAFDYTRYGGIEGTLRTISATTFVDESNRTYYRGTVELAKDHAGTDPTTNQLVPGMTVDADIISGERSLLSYLLKPVRHAADTAFTER